MTAADAKTIVFNYISKPESVRHTHVSIQNPTDFTFPPEFFHFSSRFFSAAADSCQLQQIPDCRCRFLTAATDSWPLQQIPNRRIRFLTAAADS